MHHTQSTVAPDAPVALFVSAARHPHPILPIAAEAGFRVIQAPWHSCESLKNGTLIRDGVVTFSEDGISKLEHPILARCSVVAALSLRDPAVRLITDIALRSDALVGCMSLLGKIPTAATLRYAVFGIADFHPSESLVVKDACFAADQDISDREHFRSRLTVLLRNWAKQSEISSHDLLHRLCAPCALVLDNEGRPFLADPLHSTGSDDQAWRELARRWLAGLYRRVACFKPVEIPSKYDGSLSGLDDIDTSAALFPVLFDTPPLVDTAPVAGDFVYLHEDLQSVEASLAVNRIRCLTDILCRRRVTSGTGNNGTVRRPVEPGVGRAVLTNEVCVPSMPALRDYTVLGIGLTPFSEGGYVEIGRKIDGKASLLRAWHRKYCAERLEAHGCRASRVLAIIRLEDEGIEMPNGISPAALVLRGFRCVWRVKQLDPLICPLHSVQHTPLVYDYLLSAVREIDGIDRASLECDEHLARQLESQLASQESLRALVRDSVESNTSLRRVRLKLIEEYGPLLIKLARCRLAAELGLPEDNDSAYIDWFSESLGFQLRRWHHLRFLHDYHHPGVSRWSPGHLYTLGENNVTLLAEFPDLDTGIFVDDDSCDSYSSLQLSQHDVEVLRENYQLFHERDLKAAATVVSTLSGLLLEDSSSTDSRMERFWSTYGCK